MFASRKISYKLMKKLIERILVEFFKHCQLIFTAKNKYIKLFPPFAEKFCFKIGQNLYERYFIKKKITFKLNGNNPKIAEVYLMANI